MRASAFPSESGSAGSGSALSSIFVELQCPRCNSHLDDLACSVCNFEMEIRDCIVYALPKERCAYYARFIREYEHIRAAEGRGSRSDIFYLSLPYRDITGHNSSHWKIRSISYDFLVRHVFKPNIRHGSPILDLGAGNCWMSYRLAKQGYSPVAVDLLTNVQDGLGAAVHFDIHLPTPFPRFQAEASRLPFRDEQFSAAIFNASFHYAEDYEVTLREALRCLKPGGMVIITDTPVYSREESGRKMVEERRAMFLRRFGTASDSVKSLEYLTHERLRRLEQSLSIQWTVYRPWYGWKWAMRPWMARLRSRREPSRFHIYTAKKNM